MIQKEALISNCGNYRYWLSRIWEPNDIKVLFIGLNPSIADADIDDPTIRRCIRFTQDWGYGGFYMVNLFAFRATKPKIMMESSDPVGSENGMHLLKFSERCALIVCAWGNKGEYKNRDENVLKLIESHHYKTYCFNKTKNKQPRHPLYVRADEELKPYYE